MPSSEQDFPQDLDLSQQPAMIPATTKGRGGSAASKKDFHAAP
jgi:hypothetical protein